ncbi:antitoxin [Vallicoccus soli]|uniref:Antitoxin n=2 Tax=Vallicoccus soli TaxID=2339232 RepID=A0A3A3Z0B3_9ACTN|nr:antitoxin [Vallicoccus soli]
MGIEGMQEKASDAGIEKAGDAVDQKTGGKGESQVDKAQQAADQKVGGQ